MNANPRLVHARRIGLTVLAVVAVTAGPAYASCVGPQLTVLTDGTTAPPGTVIDPDRPALVNARFVGSACNDTGSGCGRPDPDTAPQLTGVELQLHQQDRRYALGTADTAGDDHQAIFTVDWPDQVGPGTAELLLIIPGGTAITQPITFG